MVAAQVASAVRKSATARFEAVSQGATSAQKTFSDQLAKGELFDQGGMGSQFAQNLRNNMARADKSFGPGKARSGGFNRATLGSPDVPRTSGLWGSLSGFGQFSFQQAPRGSWNLPNTPKVQPKTMGEEGQQTLDRWYGDKPGMEWDPNNKLAGEGGFVKQYQDIAGKYGAKFPGGPPQGPGPGQGQLFPLSGQFAPGGGRRAVAPGTGVQTQTGIYQTPGGGTQFPLPLTGGGTPGSSLPSGPPKAKPYQGRLF